MSSSKNRAKNNIGKIKKPMMVVLEKTIPRVPVQRIGADRRRVEETGHGGLVLMAKDRRPRFRKKANQTSVLCDGGNSLKIFTESADYQSGSGRQDRGRFSAPSVHEFSVPWARSRFCGC